MDAAQSNVGARDKMQQKSPRIQCLITDDKARGNPASRRHPGEYAACTGLCFNRLF
jgi:hypothetical protein